MAGHRLKIAHDDPPGQDFDSAWDYVASFSCPDTTPQQTTRPPVWPPSGAARERLAAVLLRAGAGNPKASEHDALVATRMAEALMGQKWVELYCRSLHK